MERIGRTEKYKFDIIDFLDFEKAYDAIDAHTRVMILSGWVLDKVERIRDGAEYHATYVKGE